MAAGVSAIFTGNPRTRTFPAGCSTSKTILWCRIWVFQGLGQIVDRAAGNSLLVQELDPFGHGLPGGDFIDPAVTLPTILQAEGVGFESWILGQILQSQGVGQPLPHVFPGGSDVDISIGGLEGSIGAKHRVVIAKSLGNLA